MGEVRLAGEMGQWPRSRKLAMPSTGIKGGEGRGEVAVLAEVGGEVGFLARTSPDMVVEVLWDAVGLRGLEGVN